MSVQNEQCKAAIYSALRNIFMYLPRLDPDEKERISIEHCINRKLAEDVYAEQSYPLQPISAFAGELLNITKPVESLEHYYSIEDQYLARKILNEDDPFGKAALTETKMSIPASFQMGQLGNTVISPQQKEAWTYFEPGEVVNYDIDPIRVGQGIVDIGEDYYQYDRILEKDTLLGIAHKSLLRQAGVNEVCVYKKDFKIAVIYMDYGFDALNQKAQFHYVQDCLEAWGYPYEVLSFNALKPKVYPLGENEQRQKDFREHYEHIKEVCEQYDFLITCDFPNESFYANRFEYKNGLHHQRRINQNAVSEVCEFAVRETPKKIQVNEYDEDRMKGSKVFTYEKKAILFNLKGHIQDVILAMNMYVRPALKARFEGEFRMPELKIGQLKTDFNSEQHSSNQPLIYWAKCSNTEKLAQMRENYTGEVNIEIDQGAEYRRDQLDMLRQNNALVLFQNENKHYKAGDLFYYFEV